LPREDRGPVSARGRIGGGLRVLLLALFGLLVMAGCSTPKSYVTLLSSPDGTTGKVFVTDASGSRVLERAGQATALDGRAATTFEVSAEQVDRDFGQT